MYGNDSVSGTIGNVSQVCGGQLLEFTMSGGSPRDAARRIGCVLTMTSGAAAGESTRICGINPANGNPQMLAFPRASLVAPTDTYIINGVPFSGMGFGYSPSAGSAGPALTAKRAVTVDGKSMDCELALLPAAPENANPPGGANSDYTAPDYQHMMLAFQVPSQSGSSAISTPLPSLHRPELIQYWAARCSITDWSRAPDLLRMIMLRPNTIDNPQFPAIDPVNGPWDVDNDGDGVPDSVWVDLGLPVRWTADGRAYKPLFAILCVDMDGRLNLNAHGMCKQAEPGYNNSADLSTSGWQTGGRRQERRVVAARPRLWPGGGQSDAVVRGSRPHAAICALSESFGRRPGDAVSGTLRRIGFPLGSRNHAVARPAQLDLAANRQCVVRLLGQLLDRPGEPELPLRRLRFAAGPARLRERGARSGRSPVVFVDGRGDQQHALRSRPVEQRATKPGAARPGAATNRYSPFGPSEMERILRPYDCDATRLPSRLASLTATQSGNPNTTVLLAKRYAATTESWDVPCPSIALPPALRTALQSGTGGGLGDRPRHVVDLLVGRLIKEGVPQNQWARESRTSCRRRCWPG